MSFDGWTLVGVRKKWSLMRFCRRMRMRTDPNTREALGTPTIKEGRIFFLGSMMSSKTVSGSVSRKYHCTEGKSKPSQAKPVLLSSFSSFPFPFCLCHRVLTSDQVQVAGVDALDGSGVRALHTLRPPSHPSGRRAVIFPIAGMARIAESEDTLVEHASLSSRRSGPKNNSS